MLGITAHHAAEFPRGFADDLLQRYAEWLRNVRGLAIGTIRYRMKTVKTMLTRFQITQPAQLTKWTPQRIVDFVSSEAARVKPARAQNIACTVRSLLRYLLQEGLICRDLSAAVPTFAHWRLAPLPETLQKEELVRLLQVPNVQTAVGLRDRAILLCLSEVGLRASDVAGMKLGGIDLASSALVLYRNKPRKTTTLPMTRRLARALDAYLRRGRPACKSPFVFVLHRPPVGRPLTPATVSDIAWRMGERANLRKQVRGAHVLRHTFASRLLCAGASLKQVADLLGHRSIDTTTIYAKVDFKLLSRVAMPWPGAKEARR
jgi:site-specific recombinase XerD